GETEGVDQVEDRDHGVALGQEDHQGEQHVDELLAREDVAAQHISQEGVDRDRDEDGHRRHEHGVQEVSPHVRLLPCAAVVVQPEGGGEGIQGAEYLRGGLDGAGEHPDERVDPYDREGQEHHRGDDQSDPLGALQAPTGDRCRRRGPFSRRGGGARACAGEGHRASLALWSATSFIAHACSRAMTRVATPKKHPAAEAYPSRGTPPAESGAKAVRKMYTSTTSEE